MTIWVGTWGYLAGTSGTVAVPKGAIVRTIVAHASTNGASFTIFGGASIPVINGAAPFPYVFEHRLLQAGNDVNVSGSADIVFTNTDHYFIEFVKSGNVP